MRRGCRDIQSEDASENVIIVTIPSGMYGKETVLKASYKHTGEAFVKVTRTWRGFSIRMQSKDSKTSTKGLVDQFCNDLVDYELRTIISAQTQDIRTALVERAFSV